MKIKKTYKSIVPNGKILNVRSTNQTDTYSCDYINKLSNGTVLYINASGTNTKTITLNDDFSKYSFALVRFGVSNEETKWSIIKNDSYHITKDSFMTSLTYCFFVNISISSSTLTWSSYGLSGWSEGTERIFEVIAF